MPKKDTEDPIIFADSVLDQIISKHDPAAVAKTGRDPKKVASGIKGGSKGGHSRAKNLTAKQKKAIATKAANSRWAKK